jgi:hypothetical protein
MNEIHSSPESIQDYESADCVIGHSFGTSTHEGSVNNSLARIVLELSAGRPVIADRMLVDTEPLRDAAVACTVEGDISDAVGHGVGSWGTLVEAKRYMTEHGLNNPIMVAQAYHIGRVMRQAAKLDIHAMAPDDLPFQFDRESEQLWTRSKALWIPRELIGQAVLRRQGKL